MVKNSLKKIFAACSIILIVAAGYYYIARPYQLRWGATKAEIMQPMPGDELDPHPGFLATRAITVNAPASVIWPWLVQMGFDRAGFYGYDIIENIGSKTGMHSADSIIPELQHISVGDKVPISLVAATKMYAIEPNQYLIWSGDANDAAKGGFTWALYPIDNDHTRLVSRIRWTHHWSNLKLMPLDLFTELTDHLAVRRILPGIKVRAEGGHIPSMTTLSIVFFLYLAAAIGFLISIIRLLIRRLTTKSYLICLLSGIAWLLIWYSPFSS